MRKELATVEQAIALNTAKTWDGSVTSEEE